MPLTRGARQSPLAGTSCQAARYLAREFSWSAFMTVNLVTLQPIIALIAGVLILLMPRLLNYIVAIYLIVIGISGLVR
jgi:Protein of unknown function (DUF3096)